MSFSDYGSSSSELPDRPLVVKCTFDRSLKRISFQSAVNCTYDLLRTKIEQSFSLSASSFTVSYKDDDGEITVITNDFDLVEAVHYFQAGDDLPGSSNASVSLYRGGAGGRKITLRVQVVVDYDGPSLSDTASLASRDDDFPHGQNRQSWSLSQASGSGGGYSLSGGELEDDAVTVSSRDPGVSLEPLIPTTTAASHHRLPPSYRLPSHSVPSVATSPPSPPLSEEFEPAQAPSPDGSYQVVPSISGLSSPEHIPSASSSSWDNQPSSSGSYDISGSSGTLREAVAGPSSAPVDVFQRLKKAEKPGSAASSTGSYSPLPSTLTSNERGVKWLQEQNARTLQNMIGAPPPSSSSDASSISLSYHDESADAVANLDNGIRGDLALQQDLRGRFYYTYTSDNGSQQSGNHPSNRYSLSSDAFASHLDRRISTTSQNLAWLASHQTKSKSSSDRSRSQLNGDVGRSPRPAVGPPVALSTSSKGSRVSSSSKNRPLPDLPESIDPSMKGVDMSKIPPELLPFLTSPGETFAPPELVTDCSSCEVILDSFRYVCSICGPKKAYPPTEYEERRKLRQDVFLEEDQYDPKGKGKAILLSEPSSPNERYQYPPRSDSLQKPHPPLTVSPAWGFLSSAGGASAGSATAVEHSSPLSTLSNLFRSRPKGFKKMESRPSMKSSSTGGSSESGSMLSLPDTAVGTTPLSPPGSPLAPLSPHRSLRHHHNHVHQASFEEGYELCSNCIYTAGVSHAYEGALDLNQGRSHSHSHSHSSGGLSGSVETLVSTHSHGSHGCPVSPLSSPEEAEMTLRRSAPSEKGRKRHAFVESVWDGGDVGWKVIEQDDKRVCSICDASLATNRYKCVSCPQFDLCGGCYSQVHEIHPSHAFLAVPDRPLTVRSASPTAVATASELEGNEEQSLKHPDVSCYNCGLDIVGARFHCAVCKSVDICQNCESAGLPGNLTTNTDGGHDSSHIMIKIPYPLDSTEVAFASRRARVLWSERDAATIDATTKRVTPRSRSNSLDSSYAATVLASRRGRGGGTTDPLDHLIKCNGCNGEIVGVRYQCANCPSSPAAYNLCHDCERLSFVIHPLPHVFIKFNRRVNHPLQSSQPLLPILYEEPSEGDFVDSVADLSRLMHDATYCDRCMTLITGAWYRCVYCGGDMCDLHEQTHNVDHCCLVFKSKVNLHVLQTITDIDNPSNSTALFHRVYHTSP